MKKKKKILFIVQLYRDRNPCQRFRFEQYISFIEENGWETKVSNLISPRTDKIFYSKGKVVNKIYLIFTFLLKRLRDVLKASRYDIVFVQREACFVGLTIFEKLFSKRTKLIFDFDDSIWLADISNANRKFDWIKNGNKINKIISYSNTIIAGNDYLRQFALNNNNNVVIIPTTINTKEYKYKQVLKSDKIVIGWSGSVTTIQHFKFAIPYLLKLKKKYSDRIEIKVIGDKNYRNEELDIKGIPWNKNTEIEDLLSFDIGIMPLPNDEWAKGKCGLKGLQYMALEIPTIMSPVGVNSEIIQDGENGFLADKEQEWFEKLSLLIENKVLREELGKSGRRTVVERYSVEANKQKYLDVFNEIIK